MSVWEFYDKANFRVNCQIVLQNQTNKECIYALLAVTFASHQLYSFIPTNNRDKNTLFGTVRYFAISTYVNHSDIKRALLLFLFKRISMSAIYVRVQTQDVLFLDM